MTKLTWGDLSERNFEYGVDRGVFYPKGGIGYVWNGLTSVVEKTIDAGQSIIYIDGIGHRNQIILGNFAAAISAMAYPKEFEPYDGYGRIFAGQRRPEFNFSYRTMQAEGHYKIHLVYNALATPTELDVSSINSTTELEPFTWDLTTRSEWVQSARSSAHFVIDTKLVNPGVIEEIESFLYGNEASAPAMPTVIELLNFFNTHAILRITDHGDGTWTAEGPDDVIQMLDPTTFQINWKSAIYITNEAYTIATS